MSTSLADQIMDELMERPRTATELAQSLGAEWAGVASELIGLWRTGLIEPAAERTRNQEAKWSMKKTERKSA